MISVSGWPRAGVLLGLVSVACAASAQPGPPAPGNTAGVCPAGSTRVDIASVSALEDASRGEGAYAGDPANTCYFIANGTYQQSGSTLIMYILKGGSSAGPRSFVGATRQGVVIRGRATIDDGVSNVVITNMTFDLTGYSQSGSFNTLTLNQASNVTVSQVSFTGDCATGYKGGHIESDGVNGLTVDSFLVEKFGHCASGGHEDHGIYLANGSNITIRNSIVRDNASRGIQMYTQGGEYGTLSNVTLERNWIYANGHGDYEDGIVINATGTGTITNVLIQRNLIYRNYYSGIRFVGDAMSEVSVVQNTFDSNGAPVLLGESFGGQPGRRGLRLGGDVRQEHLQCRKPADQQLLRLCRPRLPDRRQRPERAVGAPPGAANCVGTLIQANPQFVDAANGDYHTQNPVVAAYGAYGGMSQPASLSIGDVSVTEGNGGSKSVTLTVTLSSAP